ncbi:MAG: hypothetical protein AMXMBFR84_27900 [Candidatus Hydrogenedentota bacterium]
MSPEIRILRSGDQAIFYNVADGVFDHTVDPDLASEFISDPRHHVAVAIDQGQVVGFASGVHYVHPDKAPELWVNEVGVAPSHQGRGLAKAIVRTLLQHAKRLGCREAWVLTDRSNGPAMRLYASAGGKEVVGEHVMYTFALDHGDLEEGTG